MWSSTPEIYAEIFLSRDLKNSDSQHHWDHSAALVQTVQCLLPEHQCSPRSPGIGPDSTARNKGRIKMQRQAHSTLNLGLQRRTVGANTKRRLCCCSRKQTVSPFEAGWQHNWWVPNYSHFNLTLMSLDLFIWGRTGKEGRVRKCKEEYHQCNMGKYFKERTQLITSSVNWSLASILLPKNKYMCVSMRSTSCSSEGTSQRCTNGAQFWKAIYTDQESAISSVQHCFVLHVHWF